ncbi:MAG TPA: VCBS repeat-containing protein [Terriglobales bacterium]|nr:VCBS repeat-containing protein [Terriglobales bacterium]
MKKCLVVSVMFVFASLSAFASRSVSVRSQPSASRQMRVRHIHPSRHASSQVVAHPHGAAVTLPSTRPPVPPARQAAIPAPKGRFSTRHTNGSSLPTVSFIAAARTLTGGEDDDETEPVMGDFNGDGNMDVAKIVANTVGQTTTYSISVVLGNGDGTFQTAMLTNTPGNADDPIVVGDVNGDGNDDILQIHPEGDDCRAARRRNAQPQDCGGSSVDVLLSNGDGTFAAPVNYPISDNGLNGGVLADLTANGKLDILVVDNATPADVIELLGVGDGTFQAASTVTTLAGAAPNGLFFADFNGDGKLDIASGYGQVEVYLATDSGFAAPVSLVTPDTQYDSCFNTSGDLNGDGMPEIVSVNCDDENSVTIYVNNGDGTFQTGVYYNLTGDLYQEPSEAAIGDLNGDGNADIVVGNTYGGDLSILLGNGDGTVAAQKVNYGIGGYPWFTPLLADFNGDGLPDVVMPDDYFNFVYLQGYGDGSFDATVNYPLPNSFDQYAWTYSVATGDFNGDGIPDVVAGQIDNHGSTGVVVYLGKGDGTFYPGVSYGDSFDLGYVAVADFNGDGKLDIAATDPASGVVNIFLGNGDGTFSIGLPFSTGGSGPQNIVTGDFNHDGKIDIAVANEETGNVAVLLGNGDGTFASAVTYPTTGYNPYLISTADLNGDGYLDLAVTAYTDGTSAVGVFLANNDNSGTFKTVTYTVTNGYPILAAFGDLNNDGNLDMAVTEDEGTTYPGLIEVGLGNGDGTFGTLTAYPSSVLAEDPGPGNIQMYDINGDGNLDLVYLNSNFGTLAVMYGNGDGTMNSPVEWPANDDTYGMALADVNQDGATDVLVGNDYAGGFSVLLNATGTGTAPNFSIGTQTPTGTVTAGSSATYTLNLAGSFGYNGTITFACGNLPAGTTCSFSPTSVVAQGILPLTTTLTVTTTADSASLLRPERPGTAPGSRIFVASLSGMGLFGLLLLGAGNKDRKNDSRNSGTAKMSNGKKRPAVLLLGVMTLLMVCTLVGCSGSSSTKTVTSTGTPAGSYIVTVTSTGTGTGAPSHSLNLTLVVQ